MEKLTKKRIKEMANEIAEYCHENGFGDVIMYYNNKRVFVNYYGHEDMEVQEDINPHDYLSYCAYNHIFSISSEGGLDLEYELFNEKELYKIFRKYGVYAELGNSWNCSCYVWDDNMEVEYMIYEKPKERKYFGCWNVPDDGLLIGLVNTYKDALNKTNPNVNGSCIIGDGINFEVDGQPYKFSTNYNQSDVVDSVIDVCKKYLEENGAENIWYDCGRLD